MRRSRQKISVRRGEKPPVVQPAVAPRVTAAEALDRINMPAEALERIGSAWKPGSSLVISDQGLGNETGRGTDFIVVTHYITPLPARRWGKRRR